MLMVFGCAKYDSIALKVAEKDLINFDLLSIFCDKKQNALIEMVHA